VIPRIDGQAPSPVPQADRPVAPPAAGASTNPSSRVAQSAAEPGAGAAEKNLQLAAVLAAVDTQTVVPAGAAPLAVSALLSLAGSRLAEEDRAFLGRMLQALIPRRAGEGGEAIRERVEAGGLLLEARIRQVLAQQPSGDVREVLQALGPDVRVLLGRLLREPARIALAGEQAAVGDGQEATPAASVAGRATTQAGAVAERILGQQLELAYRWMADGVLTFDVTVRLPGEETRATVQFQQEREAAGSGARAGASSVSVHVDSSTLGPIEATARWQDASCQAVCYVSTEAALAALRGESPSLHGGLSAVFPRASVDVVLDPSRAARRPSGFPPGPLPGGSVVSVRG